MVQPIPLGRTIGLDTVEGGPATTGEGFVPRMV